MGAALRRARELMTWAPCAPVWVRGRLLAMLERAALLPSDRGTIEAMIRGLASPEDPLPWAVAFPVVTDSGPGDLLGGLLVAVASDAGVLPPRGGVPSSEAAGLDVIAAPAQREGLSLRGLPARAEVQVIGRSGAAALWLAARARETGRQVPQDLVVSADLVHGPEGRPLLAPVSHGAEKARIVARERPGARLLLCGDGDVPNTIALRPGASVAMLERLVWGEAAVIDRGELRRIAGEARVAFDDQDYASAGARYRTVAEGGGEARLRFEACLRLAAIAVHLGQPAQADAWFQRADAVPLPAISRGAYTVERLTSLAGARIDAFDPLQARRLLERPELVHALGIDHPDPWERIQVLGAWRRLHLLEGSPAEARDVQRALLDIADEVERPRALLDLAWTEARADSPDAAWTALEAACATIDADGEFDTFSVQRRAFLSWYAARLAARSPLRPALAALLAPERLGVLLAHPHLQAAPRWRLEAVQAATRQRAPDLRALSARLSPFQRWYLGVYLLDLPDLHDVARACLSSAEVDLSAMPALSTARERLAAGEDPEAADTLRRHAAY